MPEVVIEQLRDDGQVYRVFKQHPRIHELDGALHRITYAYHLPSTRVSVNGERIELVREYTNGHREVSA